MNFPRHYDDDPPPLRSPRLYGDLGGMPGRAAFAENPRATSPAKLRRLRRMAIIKACRDASPPVPFSTLVCELEISDSQARLLYKKAKAYDLRRSRV